MPRYLFTAIVSVLIIIAVLIPGSNIPAVNIVGFDKFVHLGMFATWAVAVRYDLHPKFNRLYLIVLAGLFFSLLTEVLQIQVEGRTFDIYDMVADTAGLLAGLLVSNKILALMNKLKFTKREKGR